MNINVPDWARDHFWDEPPPGHHEFWSMGRFKPKCQPGETINFRFDGRVVATAVVDRIEKPGQSKCAGTGRFEKGWKVYWLPETFIDLRQPDEDVDDDDFRPTLFHGSDEAARAAMDSLLWD